MKILLAPAETKNKGGDENPFSTDNFFLKENFSKREQIFDMYTKYVSSLSEEELSKHDNLKLDTDDVIKIQHIVKNDSNIILP